MSTPYGSPVASDYSPSRPDLGLLRDAIAIVLVLAGLSAIAVALFMTDWRLGVGFVGVVATTAGVYLGYER